ncbi:MAG: hypothetical protein LH615_04010, partial [Ferruginibacter sp.]|nr:hypothetical protein [Ferruginibacter sp.]
VEVYNTIDSKEIKEIFPELFKSKFVVGNWYKSETGAIANHQGGNKGYGCDVFGIWHDDIWNWDPKFWEPATRQEVLEMFKKEAIKRGFKNGVRYVDFYKTTFSLIDFDGLYLSYDLMGLSDGNGAIFQNGVWAEILPCEKTIKEQIIELLKQL